MLGINRIYNEDCLEGMKQIDDKSIDCIICDLPYGTTACAWDIIIPFNKLWEQYNRIIKDNGAILLFGQEPFSSYSWLDYTRNMHYAPRKNMEENQTNAWRLYATTVRRNFITKRKIWRMEIGG